MKEVTETYMYASDEIGDKGENIETNCDMPKRLYNQPSITQDLMNTENEISNENIKTLLINDEKTNVNTTKNEKSDDNVKALLLIDEKSNMKIEQSYNKGIQNKLGMSWAKLSQGWD